MKIVNPPVSLTIVAVKPLALVSVPIPAAVELCSLKNIAPEWELRMVVV